MKHKTGQRSHFISRAFLALLGALLVNLAVFTLAPLLLRTADRPPQQLTDVSSLVFSATPVPEEEPVPLPEQPPPPDPTTPEMEIEPEPPTIEELETPTLDLDIDPEIMEVATPILPLPQSKPQILPKTKPKPKIKVKKKPKRKPEKKPKAKTRTEKQVNTQAKQTRTAPASPSSKGPAPSAPKTASKSSAPPSPPKAISRPRPPYPITAKRRSIEGWVKVRFFVDSSGTVSRVSVVASSPPGIFDNVVRQAVAGWRFKPGTKNGKAVSAWVAQTIQFQLRN